MRNLIVYIFIVMIFSYSGFSTDTIKTSKPEPMAEKIFKFPEYKDFTLDNGLRVFIVEDNKQPTIYFRLLVAGGKSVDTLKPGTAEITAGLLTKGTKKYNALEIAKTIDGVGASIHASASTDFVTVESSGLKKHMNTILDVYTQVITNSVFPEKEFEKIIPQMIASIQQEKSNPRTIASKLSRKAIYGENHPYALAATESSVKQIKIADIKNYYSNYFAPNNSTLLIVGDVKPNDIIKEIKKRFKSWVRADKDFQYNLPIIKPLPLGVYFVERPGSVQSTIMFSLKGLPYSHRDYETLELASNIISGGFAGRLFRTLREQYSYTYTPFGMLTQNKFIGRYICGADVRKEVTDSAITVMFEQINSLTQELSGEDELSRVKTYQSGTYKMSFESLEVLGNLIQDAVFYGKPVSELESYSSRIMNISAHGIKNIASRYLSPSKGYLVVVGSPEVKSKLSAFGKIYDYDLDLNPLSGEKAKMEPVSMTAVELIGKYIKAIGGNEQVDKIETVIDTCEVEMIYGDNQMKGSLIQYQRAPGQKYMDFDMAVFRQEVWVNGQEVWVKVNKLEKMISDEAEKFIYDARLFKDAYLIEMGYSCTVLGKQGGNILMKAVSPKGFESTFYYDSKTFLINKIERVETTGTGTIPLTEYIREYVEIEGVKFPKVIESINPINTIKTVHYYTVNQPVDETIFTAKE